MAKIGVYGGSFNPIHNGHLLLAEQAREELALDKVIFVPAYLSPFKTNGLYESSYHRCELVRLAISCNTKYFDMDTWEVDHPEKISYTVDTLTYLKTKRYPNDELYLIIGSDNFHCFHAWKDPETIKKLAKIVVGKRPGYQTVEDENLIFIENVTTTNSSSTEIRERLHNGKSIKYMVPREVDEYIHFRRLYQKLNNGS